MRRSSLTKILCVLSSLVLITACDATSKTTEQAQELPNPGPHKQNVLMIIVDDLNDWVGVTVSYTHLTLPTNLRV